MIRIGVLGAGGHSSGEHGPALAAVAAARPELVELAAVCDLQIEKARTYAERFGFSRAYTDIEQMLDAQNLNALVAVTPIVLTEQIAGSLLPRGIPLVIEKPPGPDSASARRLLQIARETGTPHMVSFNRRFSPAVARARKWLAEHAADRPPQVVLGRMVRYNRTEDAFVTGTGIHLIDAVISVLGRPVRVWSENLPTADPTAFFTQSHISFESGARACCIISPVSGVRHESYEIHGRDWCIQADSWQGALRIWDCDRLVEDWSAPDGWGLPHISGTVGETEALVDALSEGAPLKPDLADALQSLLVAEAIAAGGEREV